MGRSRFLLLILALVLAVEGKERKELVNVVKEGDTIKVEASICEGTPRSLPRRCQMVWETTATYTLGVAQTADVNVTIPDHARLRNGTLSLRVSVFAPTAHGLIASAGAAATTFAPRPRPTRYLLSETVASLPAWRPDELFLRWRPRASLLLGVDSSRYPDIFAMPPALRSTADTEEGLYSPPLLISFLGVRSADTVELNAAAGSVQPLQLSLSLMQSSRIVWLASVEASSAPGGRQKKQQQQSVLTVTEREMDDVKAVFLETHPVLLWITVAASALHLLFDALAIKNDVGFWLKRKGDVQGISIGGIACNAVLRLVILLYLLDNDSSVLILVPTALTAVVDWWKVTRALRVTVTPKFRIGLAESYKLGSTSEFDKKAFRMLGLILLPIVLGYSAYSLVYMRHKSWYSWALSSVTSVVYVVGFVLMTPQLFINYKLKTVAHLPWRALVYRALNTFIDDLFALFLRGIPTMHRLACFRDDVVFFIYLYQRWLYPVDSSRAPDDTKPKSQ